LFTSVCLDLLTDPVDTPCGHSFCMVCIDDCWDQNDQRGIYSCPQCRETFTPRPVLRRNNMLAEVVEKLKKTELQAASTAHCYTGPADVECDFCTGRKLKAIKSCLMCQASFCETHLKPHYEVLGLKKHKLVKASSDLQEKICSQHDEMIKIYCRTDQSYICFMCTMEEHRGHDTVSAATERTQKQKEQRKHQQRIQEKEKKVQDLTQAVDSLKRSAQAAVMDSERIFTELIRSIEKKRCEVRELIRDQEKTELSRAEGLLDQLEQEIADLKRRDTELEQLSHTEDHIHFLQSFQSLCVSSGSEDSPSIPVHQHLSFDGEFWKEEFNKIPPHSEKSCPAVKHNDGNLYLLPKTREAKDQRNFCHLTLDPNKAHRCLSLSENNRVVIWKRFDGWVQVLFKESVCAHCYWEVEWSSKGGMYISVSYKDISRKGLGYDCGFGHNSQSWSLRCSSTLSFWHNNIKTEIPGPPSSRIGVYVDHSAGTLSFYRVSDTMTLLHTVHTTFTQPLYGNLYKNTARYEKPSLIHSLSKYYRSIFHTV
uniref:Tripartite motif-containing protein 16-like n=1 Tax=Electrophorus electricus TaxID=8005 RepID=A0A4W4G5A1_ELEEL